MARAPARETCEVVDIFHGFAFSARPGGVFVAAAARGIIWYLTLGSATQNYVTRALIISKSAAQRRGKTRGPGVRASPTLPRGVKDTSLDSVGYCARRVLDANSSFITRSSRGRVAPAERAAAAAAAAAARPRAPRRRTGTPSRAADQPSRAAARTGRAAAAGAPPSCPRGLRAAAPPRTRQALAAAGA